MIFEQYFEQYLDELERLNDTGTDRERELLANSLLSMYQVTGRKECRELAEKLWDGNQGRLSLLLWKCTRQNCYLEAARQKAAAIKMVFPECCESGQLEDILYALPFYMEWDVTFGEKKHLNEMVQWVQKLEQLQEKAYLTLRKTAVLEALLGCSSVMPEEAYDLYRYLGTYLKKEINRLLLQCSPATGLLESNGSYSISESAVLAEAIFEGCRLGFLPRERYEKAGKKLLTAVELYGFIWNDSGLLPKEKGQEWACMKAWSGYKRQC